VTDYVTENRTVYDTVTNSRRVPVVTKCYVNKPVTTYERVKTGYNKNVNLVRNAPSRSYRSSSYGGYSNGW